MTEILVIYFAIAVVLGAAGLAFAALVRATPGLVRARPAAWHRAGCACLLGALLLPVLAPLAMGFSRGSAVETGLVFALAHGQTSRKVGQAITIRRRCVGMRVAGASPKRIETA